MGVIFYIAEGEIEERFFDFLKHGGFIRPGRFKKFNLTQNDLKDNSNILTTKVKQIFCILDTDCVDMEKLFNNISKLEKICGNNVQMLIQNKNFEGELRYMLDCNDLFNFFKLPHHTTKDLKKYLAQDVDYSKFLSKDNLLRYCCRPNESIHHKNIIHFKEILK